MMSYCHRQQVDIIQLIETTDINVRNFLRAAPSSILSPIQTTTTTTTTMNRATDNIFNVRNNFLENTAESYI